MLTHFRPALSLLIVMTAVTGAAYPALVTGIAQAVMPGPANGSMIDAPAKSGGKVQGSRLIGQPFSDPKHFWSRPSATAPQPYNGLASGGSNLGPLNPALTDGIRSRMDALRAVDPTNRSPIPVDLVTASASGLDPDISLAAAYYQAPRVARERGLQPQAVLALIAAHARGRWLGILGEPRVSVLDLNLALDAMK
jgi:K+-transporting ATPase ATPase C chain